MATSTAHPMPENTAPPNGSVGEFVPKRQVEIYSHHYLGSHYNRHHPKAAPVIGSYDILYDVDICYYGKESKQGEDDEELHGLCLCGSIVAVGSLAKDKRLVGVAEGLRYNRHNHRNLACRPVYAQLCRCITAGVNKREKYLVGGLVEYPCNSKYQYGPTVVQYLAHEPAVENILEAC